MIKNDKDNDEEKVLVQLAESIIKNFFMATEYNLKILENNIKMCENKKQNLLNNLPFTISKKKRIECEKEIERINEEIMSYYKDVTLEINEINEITSNVL